MDAVRLMKELKANYEQEADFLPKETGLNLIVSAQQVRGANHKKTLGQLREKVTERLFLLPRVPVRSQPGAGM